MKLGDMKDILGSVPLELLDYYEVVFMVPGGGDYSNMTLEVEAVNINHDKQRIELS